MTKPRKTGLAAALEAAEKSGMTIRTKPAATIERNMATSIRDVTARIKPQKGKKGNPALARQAGGPNGNLLEDTGASDLLRACKSLKAHWQLDSEVIANLLGASRSTWLQWLESSKVRKEIQWTGDQRARALVLLRIYEAVADLHHDNRDAASWIHEPLEAPGFAGRSPLDVMASGFEELLMVRDYLNFLHSAWT